VHQIVDCFLEIGQWLITRCVEFGVFVQMISLMQIVLHPYVIWKVWLFGWCLAGVCTILWMLRRAFD
jgi:phage-related protein